MSELVEDAWNEGLNYEEPCCDNCRYRNTDSCPFTITYYDNSCAEHEWED